MTCLPNPKTTLHADKLEALDYQPARCVMGMRFGRSLLRRSIFPRSIKGIRVSRHPANCKHPACRRLRGYPTDVLARRP